MHLTDRIFGWLVGWLLHAYQLQSSQITSTESVRVAAVEVGKGDWTTKILDSSSYHNDMVDWNKESRKHDAFDGYEIVCKCYLNIS